MATVNQLIAMIKVRLSRKSSSVDADILAEIVAAQERLERGVHLPDFLKTSDDVNVTSGVIDVRTLDPKFIRFNEDVDRAVYFVDPTLDEPEIFIKRYDDRQQMKDVYPGNLTSGGYPRAYSYSFPNLELRPKPTVDIPALVRIRYFGRDPTIPAVDATTLWSDGAPDLLAGEAGIIIAKFLRDADAISFFQEMIQRGKAELFGTDVAAGVADTELVMGE